MEIIRVAVLHTLRSFHFLLNPTRATRNVSNIQGLSLRLKIFFFIILRPYIDHLEEIFENVPQNVFFNLWFKGVLRKICLISHPI